MKERKEENVGTEGTRDTWNRAKNAEQSSILPWLDENLAESNKEMAQTVAQSLMTLPLCTAQPV